MDVSVEMCVLEEGGWGVMMMSRRVFSAPNLLALVSGASLKKAVLSLRKQLPPALSALSDVDITNIFYKVKDNWN